MKRAFWLATASLFAASAGQAQQVNQSESAWYTDAQAEIERKLARQPITGRAKNVILFVADGNSVGTNYAIRLFDGQKKGGLGDDNILHYENFPYLALVKTYNVNAQTPDSAPTASAMNTGVKSNFTTINVSENAVAGDCSTLAGNELTTFAEVVAAQDKSVGIVTTTRMTHATPAAVYSKTVHRDWEDNTGLPEGCEQLDIAAQFADAMKSGMIDLALGGGRRHFLPESVTDDEGKTGKRTDDRNIVQELLDGGAQYAWNDETFGQLDPAGGPILGLFESSHMLYEHDRTGEPSLAEMTEFAINTLSANENGYYLEVEAGRVDHANHDGNLHRVLTDGIAFADAIAKADELTDDEDTLILVTADHAHTLTFNGYCGRGSPVTGLCYKVDDHNKKHLDEPNLASDGKPYTVAGYLNGAGSILVAQSDGNYFGTRPTVTEEQATDPDYLQQALIPMSSETHSGTDVALYGKGPWAHLVDGTVEQNYIFHIMLHAVNAE